MSTIVAALPERFAKKIRVSESGCWVWTASIDRHGYGSYAVGNRRGRLAHRVAYQLVVGPIPDGLVLDHLCRVRACVNPDHLEPVTAAENTRRGTALKTECKNGHPFDDANTHYSGSGARVCRRCNADAQARVKARRVARDEAGQ